MSGDEVGSAYVSIGANMDEASLSAAKSKFSSAVSDMSSGVGGLKSSLGSELSASMSGLASSMGPVGGALSALGPAGIAAGAGIAVVGSALSSSVTTAAGFQQQMAGVAAIMGSSGAELQAMSDAAREAGATTQFSASQAAEALSYMAGAGWDSQQATAGLKDTLTLAAAGAMDLGQAGDLMTNTVAQFNLTATDSGRVANVLAAGASATNTSVSQLGAGMGVVGATAAAFGMSLESTTAALGSLSNAGIKGAEGGTALRGILASLATQTGPAADALAELGISAEQINPATVGVAEAMSLLNEKGMTATQAIKIFGRENVSAATYLAAHASSLDELETSITGTSKATEMAATQTATYEGAMGELSSAVEEAQIALGSVLLPVVTDTVQVFTAGITAVTDFGKSLYDAYADFQNWLSGVDSSFLELMGIDPEVAKRAGEEAAKNTAKSIAESNDLQKAPGGALSSPEAQDKVKDAAEKAGTTYADRFSELVKSGISKEIAGWMATDASGGMSDLMALALINAQTSVNGDDRNAAGITKTTLESGVEVELKYQTDDGMTRSTLMVNGEEVAGPVYGWGIESTIPELFEQADLGYNQGNILDLTDKLGSAALVQAKASIGVDLYTDVEQAEFKEQNEALWANFGDSTAQIISDNFDYISQSGSDDAKEAMNVILDAFAHPDATKYNEVEAAFQELSDKMLMPGQVENLAAAYQAKILPQITDIKEFCQQQGEDMGSTITDAFKGAILSDDERTLITAMKPMLDMLEKEAPEYFYKSGLPAIKAFVEAVESGMSAADLDKMWDAITGSAKKAGEDIAKNLADGTGMFFGDFQTQMHDWTEYVNSEGGFIGPTEFYDDYIQGTQSQAERAAAALANVEKIKLGVDVDTTQANEMLVEFTSKTRDVPTELDTTAADLDVLQLDATIMTAKIKPIIADISGAMDSIAALDAAASAPVTKYIYTQTVNSGSSGTGNWGSWIPRFANEGYVSRPTLAVIGDRPGGEYVVGANRFEAAASRMGAGQGVTINVTQNINGSGLSAAELERVLAKNNKELIFRAKSEIAHDWAKDKY